MGVAQLGAEALLLAVWLSLPVLGAVVVVGLVVGVLQAATQVQDASLAFVPKLLVATLAITLSAAWIGHELVAFTTRAWSQL